MTETHGPPIQSRLRWSGMTHRGRFRSNNEDAFLALVFDAREVRYLGRRGEAPLGDCDFVFAVSDGMGGANSGEFASRIAVQRITRLLPRSFVSGALHLSAGFEDLITVLFGEIHEEMSRQSAVYAECAGMGATLSLGWFVPGWVWFGHIGDSRIYYLPRGGALAQVSRDDTHVGWLRRGGKINEREAREHPRRNMLQKALGAGHQFVDPQISAVPCRHGDRFLLCTDGLVDGLWDHRIEDLLRASEPGGAASSAHADEFVREALEGGTRDNVTAVVVEVAEPGGASEEG